MLQRRTLTRLALDPSFASGAELYAAGQFWDAHEAWESLWRTTDDAEVRLFVQGLIQVAAALYKLHDKNDAAAAVRLLTRAAAKLDRVPDTLRGVNVAAFAAETVRCRIALERAPDQPCSAPVLSFATVPETA